MSRIGFGILTEDPMYDEDGVMVDEDFAWEDVEELVESGDISYDPHDTVNS
jgi:hypothetical protein